MYTEPRSTSPEGATLPRRTKSEQVFDRIRDQIITTLRPETRLASFSEMESAYGVSRTVLRDVVSQLKREGFI